MSAVLRFAPSPNGRLHLGHAYSALLNARIAKHLGGRLLLRIEDIDPIRSRPELVVGIIEDLGWLGLSFDGPVLHQSARMPVYGETLARLAKRGLAYPCFCSRRDVALKAAEQGDARDPDGAPLYPGTCRALSADEVTALQEAGAPHAWRLDMGRALDVALGPYRFNSFTVDGGETSVAADPARWGDAVIARRDVPTSYHLSVVIDDHAQAISHVVRGADLLAATDLHVLLQALLGLRRLAYHHHVLLRDGSGEKLSKSKGSPALADLRAQGLKPDDIRAMLAL